MTTRFEAGADDRPLTVIRGGFLIDGEAPRPLQPPPKLGEHTDEILADARRQRETRRQA